MMKPKTKSKAIWATAFPDQQKRLHPGRVEKKAEKKEYICERDRFLKKWPQCCVCHRHKSKDVHHTKGRLGHLLVDQINWLAVCRRCHDRIHSNPKWARENGYISAEGKWNETNP